METTFRAERFLARTRTESHHPATSLRSHLEASFRLSWLPFASSRGAMFAAAWAANTWLPYGRPHDQLQYAAPWRAWLSWDAVHYLQLARHGYPASSSAPDVGFFPLLPLLLHVVGGSAPAALILALTFGLAGLCVTTGMTRQLFGERVASRTAWVAAWWPLGFVWTAVYTEGLFLALASGSLWAAWRGRPLLAALLGFLAGPRRRTGAGLVLPLLLLLSGRRRALAAAPAVGTAVAGAVVWASTGDPFGLVTAQLQGRSHLHPANPLAILFNPAGGGWEAATGVCFAALLVLALVLLAPERGWRRPALAAVAGLVGPVLLAGTLSSLGRYLMVAFPLYWGLQKLPTRVLAAVGVPAALILTAVAGSGRLTP